VPAVLGETLNSDLKSRLVRMAENDESTRLIFEVSGHSTTKSLKVCGRLKRPQIGKK